MAAALVQDEALSGPLGCLTTPFAAAEEGSLLTGLPTILLSKLNVEAVKGFPLLLGIKLLSRSTDPEPKIIECLSLPLPFVDAEVGVEFIIAFEGRPLCCNCDCCCCNKLAGSAGTGGIELFSPGAAVLKYIDRLLEAEAATALRSCVECLGVILAPPCWE